MKQDAIATTLKAAPLVQQAASGTLQLMMKWRRISLSSEDVYDVTGTAAKPREITP